MDGFIRALVSVWTDSGFAALTWENIVMILVGLVLLYLAIPVLIQGTSLVIINA